MTDEIKDIFFYSNKKCLSCGASVPYDEPHDCIQRTEELEDGRVIRYAPIMHVTRYTVRQTVQGTAKPVRRQLPDGKD